jgi:hypothetical protein
MRFPIYSLRLSSEAAWQLGSRVNVPANIIIKSVEGL